jgi:RimJ/RimL family protein N-acetyltransferase
MIILETDRLTLRELTFYDSPFILELVNTPGWLAYIGDRNIKNNEQAKEYLKNGPLKSYAQHQFGLWLVTRKQDGEKLGICGLLKRDYLDQPDLGFAFLPEFTGQGYAQESANATIAYAHDKLKITGISALVIAENKRSIHLLDKIGMSFQKTITVGPESLQLHGVKN